MGDEWYADVCGKCGARRIDNQLGLEPTPDLYVARMVEVFREVRRVLAAHGTCWINMGDGYASQGGPEPAQTKWQIDGASNTQNAGRSRTPGSLKPKDLVGMPWRLAFALQTDGWYLRSDIIWSKPNPMPESVTDRPTKAHEYVFLLSKRPRYFFDQEAVREPHKPSSIARGEYGHGSAFKGQFNGSPTDERHQEGKVYDRLADAMNPAGRNIRSVWEIATQAFPEAHFATFPEELVRRCVLAGCPEWVCRVCGKPRERIVERVSTGRSYAVGKSDVKRDANLRTAFSGYDDGSSAPEFQTLGWSDCSCLLSEGERGPGGHPGPSGIGDRHPAPLRE